MLPGAPPTLANHTHPIASRISSGLAACMEGWGAAGAGAGAVAVAEEAGERYVCLSCVTDSSSRPTGKAIIAICDGMLLLKQSSGALCDGREAVQDMARGISR